MEWKTIMLSEFLTNREERFKPHDVRLNGIKRLSKIDFSGKIHLSEKSTNTDMVLIKKGDLVISGINVEKGAISVYKGEEDITATIHYSSYIYDSNKIDIDFLTAFVKNAEFMEAIKEQVPGGIKTEIKPKHLLQIKIKIPINPNDQRKVVSALNALHRSIESVTLELTHQLTLVKQLRQAFLREAMGGKLVPHNPAEGDARDLLDQIKAEKQRSIAHKKPRKEKELPLINPNEVPFVIPESWVWCRLGEIAMIANGNTPSQNEFISNGIPYFKVYNIRNAKIDFYHKPQYISIITHTTKLKRSVAVSGDILMNIVGPPLGKIAIVPPEFSECNFNQAIVMIRPMAGVLNSFIYWYLNEQSEIKSISTKGVAGQDNISITQSNNIKIPLPPIAEQHRIVAKLDSLMQYCQQLEDSIKASISHNEALLQQVLREALTQPQLAD